MRQQEKLSLANLEKDKKSNEAEVKEDLYKILSPISEFYSDAESKISNVVESILHKGNDGLAEFQPILSISVREQLASYLKSQKWKDFTENSASDFSFGVRMIEEISTRKHQVNPIDEKKDLDIDD